MDTETALSTPPLCKDTSFPWMKGLTEDMEGMDIQSRGIAIKRIEKRGLKGRGYKRQRRVWLTLSKDPIAYSPSTPSSISLGLVERRVGARWWM
jgi:hypothetical protein